MFQHEFKKEGAAEKQKSSVIESNNIREILKYCQHGSTLILDLDNTVMEPIQELGSDQWFVNLLNHACNLIIDKEQAAQLVITIYHAVQQHTMVQAVESEIISIIRALQDTGIPIFALTTRAYSIMDCTLRQLKEINVDFSRQWKGIFELDIGNEKNKVMYAKGIIFCNGNEKGRCLKTFFDSINHYPSHVVMVDDKEKYLTCVKNIVENYGGNFVGFRYAYLDRKVENFEMEKANKQLDEIHSKLSVEAKNAVIKLRIDLLSRHSLLFKNKENIDSEIEEIFRRSMQKNNL